MNDLPKFAFLAHPINLTHLYSYLGPWKHLLKLIPKYVLKEIIPYIPCYKILTIKDIVSIKGEKVEGIAILCPLLPEQMVSLEKKIVLKRISQALKVARSYGSPIIGLAGFTSIISNQGEDLVGLEEINITSGNTYTASLVLEGVEEAARLVEMNIADATVLIVGATGNIGNICSRVLAEKAKRLILVARDTQKLDSLVSKLRTISDEIYSMKFSDSSCFQEADIVISATNAISAIIDARQLKSGSILCDVSIPPNIARDVALIRDDVLVFEGGLARIPHFNEIENVQFKRIFPKGIIYGCLAETILLAMERRYENFSIGRNEISVDKLREITEIGKKHGFTLGQFICGDKIYNQADMVKIKLARQRFKNV